MFIRNGPHDTAVLYIPSVFISYNGDALDEKTILLRSSESLSTAAVKLLRLLGDKETTTVYATLGTEQEFFLIDRAIYNMRPDLKITGRTLVGGIPPKHQVCHQSVLIIAIGRSLLWSNPISSPCLSL
jgi:glutamine synthetase